MKKRSAWSLLWLLWGMALLLCGCGRAELSRGYNEPYTGEHLDKIAFPVGGMGAGMFCVEGTGAISHMSVRHNPEIFNEPVMFAALHVKGAKNGSKVLERESPDWKKFGGHWTGLGHGSMTWGLPRFKDAEFTVRFPFCTVGLSDDDIPLDVSVTAWSPFIPTDQDDSGLPAGALEYTFANNSGKDVEAVFSYNSGNFMYRTGRAKATVKPIANGFVLSQEAPADEPWQEGSFAIYTDDPATQVNHCWFRGAWFDPLTMAWNDIESGTVRPNPPVDNAPGASLYVPVSLKNGESKTIRLHMAWYVPRSDLRMGLEAADSNDLGSFYDEGDYKETPRYYEPWYGRRFASVEEVAGYWKTDYDRLRSGTELFADAFYASTLPAEAIEAVAANLTILKSPTVMRQHDGRLWTWEGCGDSWGSCHGSCTHVWNYAQAIPHLYPAMERSLRETEFLVGQSAEGHQVFRNNIPIRPVRHDFHAACDGQLGGIVKAYRDWRISGDTDWIESLYPAIVQSIEYCIRTWDPRETGALEEPHHNTYDIEFWGPDGMCTCFYTAALNSVVRIGKALGEDVARYETLLARNIDYMENRLFDGEYFIQDVRWKDLDAPDPTVAMTFHSTYSDEAKVILEREGPKYQYGAGCISDGVIGSWMALTAGLTDVLDESKVKSHLNAVHRYNLKRSLSDHANPQRPTYAMGGDGGLLLCTWPKGGKLQLPFVYSNEVWTGIEYQVAAHLIFMGEVEKGLEIVRICRDRYDGRVRNPFNEYECGHWYARALSSYSLLQALSGVRYDAVEKTLYICPRVKGDFTSFISTDTGFGTVTLKDNIPSVDVKYGEIDIDTYILNGEKTISNGA